MKTELELYTGLRVRGKQTAGYVDTAKAKRAFLAFLRIDGDVDKAALQVNRRTRSMRWHKKHDPEFSKEWDLAIEIYHDDIEGRLTGVESEAADAVIDSVRQQDDGRLRFRASEVILRRGGYLKPDQAAAAPAPAFGIYAREVHINPLPPRRRVDLEDIPAESEVVPEDES